MSARRRSLDSPSHFAETAMYTLYYSPGAASMVVLDDVFASLDSNRRSQTIAALCEVAKKCAQLIVLAHDAYFLYELEKVMAEEKVSEVLPLQNRRVGEFSELAPADFSMMCESDYYKRYRTTWSRRAADPGTTGR